MTTVQTEAVLDALGRLGHATNQSLHAALSESMPALSVQSLHRITARLLERGEIGLGPSDGRQVVLDATPTAHDHFVCSECGSIVDIEIPESTISSIQQTLGRHLLRDGIVVYGRCALCGESDPLQQ
jgi:Fur family transcriptional regulator, peroxide stress response regulator